MTDDTLCVSCSTTASLRASPRPNWPRRRPTCCAGCFPSRRRRGPDAPGPCTCAPSRRRAGGVGPETTLDLPPGPGLTVVAGRNGTGKSSFAEAAEMALTGFNARWDGSNGKARTAVWKEGWRNLHDSTVPTVSVRLTLDDTGDPVTVRRTWYGAKVDEARTTVERADGTEQKLEESLDASTLSLYRPFLPYSELGSMVDGTLSALHNTLARFIGLGQLGDIDDRLAARIKACKDVEKRPGALKTAAVDALTGLDDQRAVGAARALGGRTPMRTPSAPCSTGTRSPTRVRTAASGHSLP
ncbi:ATP-binding protein [Streptomyces sp. M10(2022)]